MASFLLRINAWERLRSRGQRVDWFRVFWHSKAIPRHAMIVWLAIQRRLNTQDKLLCGSIRGQVCFYVG